MTQTYSRNKDYVLIKPVVIKDDTSQSSVHFNKTENKLEQQIQLNDLRNTALKLIANSCPLATILENIISSIEFANNDMRCSILLVNDVNGSLTLGAAPSLPSFYNEAVEGTPIGKGYGSCGSAAFLKKRVIAADLMNHPYWQEYTELVTKAGLASCWSEPIFSSAGEVIGTFAIYHDTPCEPSEMDFFLIEQSANLASIAIELASANDKIWQQTNYDRLTGLANRQRMQSLLSESITYANESQTRLALLHIDLDHFKNINVTYGYEVGDELLLQVSKRVSSIVNHPHHIARTAADEFVIIFNHLQSAECLDLLSQGVQQQIAIPYIVNNTQVHLSASIGIAIYPHDGITVDELIKNAEQAMHQAKSNGHACTQYFSPEINEKSQQRQSLINDMHHAIGQEEFHLVYQPIIDINTQKLTKVEALLRWQHPVLGNIPPLDFIPLAEETGLISEIGEWVFKSAMQQMAIWRKTLDPELKVGVNSSPAQYKDGSLDQLLTYMAENQIDPTSLVVEITEGMLIESTELVARKIQELRSTGVQVAIDDFGTGYASLSYLTKFKVDYLKIDKSFVWKMHEKGDDRIICEAILMMAKNMGLKVVAEGIETQQQLELLKEMKCDYGQGYHLAKPLTPEAFETYFEQNHR